MVKKQVSILIDTDVANRCKELGINMSKASENYLRLLINAIENAHTGIDAGPLGFEPRTFSLEASWTGTAEDWKRFHEWLAAKKYASRHMTTIYNYAQRYSECLFSRDLSKLQELRNDFRPRVLGALSSLAKFTGRYEEWKDLIRRYGFKWSSQNSDQIFIDRLNSVKDSEEIWTWIKTSKEALPRVAPLLDLMATTGLRFIEGVNSVNLILKLETEDKLSSYYSSEKATLEHYRFKSMFLRNTKKAFVSFVSPETVTEILDSIQLSSNAIQKLFRRQGLPLRFGAIREAHGTYMTKHLNEPEINFLHGRVTASVFMANYFNPSLIADLKTRTFQGIKELQEKIA